jgi:Undecaprenyl-phosphate glucose phosphotransferase
MIRRRLNLIVFSLRLVVLLLPLLAFGVAAYVRFLTPFFPVDQTGIEYADYFGLLFLTTLVWAMAVEYYGLARVEKLLPALAAARQAFWACLVTYVAITGATFFYRSASFSRLFVVFSATALLLMTLGTQQTFRSLLMRLRRGGEEYSRVLMVGADEFAERAARALRNSLVLPCTPVAFVRLPGQDPKVSGARVIEFGAVQDLATRSRIDDVVIAVPPGRLSEIPAIVAGLEFLSVPVRAVLDLGPGVVLRDAVFQAGEMTFLDLRTTPSESVAYALLKRSFDLVFASLVLLFTAPLLILIALAIRLTSRGPVLFRQERIGLNGRAFRMYKFRTMRLGDLSESETRWTTRDDPRVTRLGALLRRTSLDELPQFFNVLKGDMSVVGPRPERPHFVEKFMKEVAQYNRRHYLKVGITGWAQVNGWRGDTSIAERVTCDLYYLNHWSIGLDIRIILLTLWRGFVSKNAY